jgi:hypothetical protein
VDSKRWARQAAFAAAVLIAVAATLFAWRSGAAIYLLVAALAVLAAASLVRRR